MLKIENTVVLGWEHAIRGMRNPMNSWEKSDSNLYHASVYFDECNKRWETNGHRFMIGPNDLDLMKRLRNAGTDHRKFMRMISTTLQNPETGQIVGTAALEQTAIQAACLGAFTAMSIASGQYFLAEINGKLNMMRLSLDKILEFLYGDKRAELLSEISFIRFAYENYGSIMEHEQQRLSTIVSLQSARKVAMKDIEFYLADLVSTVTAKVQTDILETVEKATQIKDSLELSTQLYVMSELLEVFYSENYDDGFLRYIEEEATAYINKCDKRMLTSFSMLQQALTSHKDGIFKKTDKEVLENQTRKIGDIVDRLNTAESSSLRELLHSALAAPEKRTDYYFNKDGDVFLKIS